MRISGTVLTFIHHHLPLSLMSSNSILVSFEREIFPQVEINETEADRTSLEKELQELLICSAASEIKGNFTRRFKERFGIEMKSPLPVSERGFNEKMGTTTSSAPDYGDDEDREEEMIWREIANHHTAIETLRAKEYRESIASCELFSPPPPVCFLWHVQMSPQPNWIRLAFSAQDCMGRLIFPFVSSGDPY